MLSVIFCVIIIKNQLKLISKIIRRWWKVLPWLFRQPIQPVGNSEIQRTDKKVNLLLLLTTPQTLEKAIKY